MYSFLYPPSATTTGLTPNGAGDTLRKHRFSHNVSFLVTEHHRRHTEAATPSERSSSRFRISMSMSMWSLMQNSDLFRLLITAIFDEMVLTWRELGSKIRRVGRLRRGREEYLMRDRRSQGRRSKSKEMEPMFYMVRSIILYFFGGKAKN